MRKIIAAVALLFWCGVLAYGQAPGPCTSKTLDGVPCFDPNFGVVVRFSPPIPTEKLAPLATPDQSATVPNLNPPPNPTLPPVTAHSERWTYEGNEAYYDDGNTVQHFDAGTLHNYASSQAQFEASYEIGAASGNVIGALVNAWVRHHQRMAVLQHENLREQFIAYDDAGLDIMRHVMQDDDAIATNFALLARLDTAEGDAWKGGVTAVLELKARTAAQVTEREKMHTEVLEPQNVKHLRKNVALAKRSYKQDLIWVEKADVWTRIVGGLAGYFASQQMAHLADGQGAANPQ